MATLSHQQQGKQRGRHPTFLPSQPTALWRMDAKKQSAEEAGGSSPIDKSDVGEGAVGMREVLQKKRQKTLLPLGFEPRRLASAALETAAFRTSYGLNLSAIAAS